jgi:hypothetical protein
MQYRVVAEIVLASKLPPIFLVASAGSLGPLPLFLSAFSSTARRVGAPRLLEI